VRVGEAPFLARMDVALCLKPAVRTPVGLALALRNDGSLRIVLQPVPDGLMRTQRFSGLLTPSSVWLTIRELFKRRECERGVRCLMKEDETAVQLIEWVGVQIVARLVVAQVLVVFYVLPVHPA